MAPLVETSTTAEPPFKPLVPIVLIGCPLVNETKSTAPTGTSIASLDCNASSKRDALEMVGKGILRELLAWIESTTDYKTEQLKSGLSKSLERRARSFAGPFLHQRIYI